jgi:hypothetical protein
MALIFADRVQQTGTANTTVSFTLSGAVTGYQSFSAIGNTNTTYYSATDINGNWEVGVGTYSTTGPTLTRTTILSSSNSGSAVTFTSTVNVWCDYSAKKVVIHDASGNVLLTGSTTLGDAVGDTTTVPDLKALQVTNPSRHSIRPSLLLDFANTRQLDPRITFTRASTATFYDDKTTALAEQNLLLQSNTFNVSPWGVVTGGTFTSPTITSAYAVAPDGTTTASRLQATCGILIADISGARQSLGVTLPNHTWSIWVISNTGLSQTLMLNVNNGASVITATTSWQRLSWTGTSVTFDIGIRGTFTGSTLDVSIWCGQVENRSSVTSYNATTTAPITNYIPALQTAASGVARFLCNPITDESLGLMIEEQRTNLLTYSSDFSNAIWVKDNVTISSNVIVAPDGTITGSKIVSTATTTRQNIYEFYSVTSGTYYTQTYYVKNSGINFAQIMFSVTGFGSTQYANYDLSLGTVGTVGAGVFSTSITNVGNNWFRISCTCLATATTGSCTSNIILATSSSMGRGSSIVGDGYSGIYVWGAQLEAGAFATSYIPTVASQVTRLADLANMTGANFSSWYNIGEGTIYSETSAPATFVAAEISDNTASNIIGTRTRAIGTTQVIAVVTNQTALQANIQTTGWAASNKVAFGYATNDFAVSLNSASVLTDTLGSIPTANRLNIGSNVSAYTTGTIKKLSYYPLRLTNAELQGLTS